MNDPLVSIIMPAYNAGKYIHSSIDSVLRQTYTNLEIIIVNDGSTDNTAGIIKSFSDRRIRYIEQENAGQCKASNTGLLYATGDLIKFFDADDVLNNVHIGRQVKKINNRTDAICSCEWGRFFDGNPESAQFAPETVWKDMKSIDWLKNALQQQYDMMGAWLWLIPRSIIEKTGGWDDRLNLNNDFEFTIRLLLNADEVLFTPGAKLFYRTGEKTLSGTKNKSAYESAYLSTKLGCSYLLKKENSRVMRQLCANRYREWIYQFYPLYPDLFRRMERDVTELGGSTLKPGGGFALKFLTSLLGWRMAKLIQRFFYKLGYRR